MFFLKVEFNFPPTFPSMLQPQGYNPSSPIPSVLTPIKHPHPRAYARDTGMSDGYYEP